MCDFMSYCELDLSHFPVSNWGASPNYFVHYNVIVTFREEGVEHVTFWSGTIGLRMDLVLESETRLC